MRRSFHHCVTILLRVARHYVRCATPQLAVALSAFLIGASLTSAQTTPAQPAKPAAAPSSHHQVHHKSRAAAGHPATPTPQVAVQPPAPPPPDWPVNDRPAPPGITFNGRGLQIDAPNSSLKQILDDVAKATGATVEGLGNDQRVFGVYGPGNPRDVLSQLLLGSGYNFILIGDNGQGVPRQIVLSTTHSAAGGAPPTAARPSPQPEDNEDDVVDNQVDTTPEPPPTRPTFGQEGGSRTPQQIIQQQQQQNQQPGAPPNQPPN